MFVQLTVHGTFTQVQIWGTFNSHDSFPATSYFYGNKIFYLYLHLNQLQELNSSTAYTLVRE